MICWNDASQCYGFDQSVQLVQVCRLVTNGQLFTTKNCKMCPSQRLHCQTQERERQHQKWWKDENEFLWGARCKSYSDIYGNLTICPSIVVDTAVCVHGGREHWSDVIGVLWRGRWLCRGHGRKRVSILYIYYCKVDVMGPQGRLTQAAKWLRLGHTTYVRTKQITIDHCCVKWNKNN